MRETWALHRVGQGAELQQGHAVRFAGEREPQVRDEGDLQRDGLGELRQEQLVGRFEHFRELLARHVTPLCVQVLHHGMRSSRRPVLVEFVDGRGRRRCWCFRLAVLGSRP